MKTKPRQTGISLIEVLVVLVILLIGIFSVVRLFPHGFLANRQSEATTIATRLAKQEVDRHVAGALSLPDSIAPVVWAGTGFRIDLDATPDDLTDVHSSPASVWDYYFSNVNKTRRIIGEQVRIPLPSPTTAGRGSIYVLANGPYMDVDWLGYDTSLFVTGAPLIRRFGESTQDPSFFVRNAAQYAVDEDAAAIAVGPAGVQRKFLLTYSYYDANWDTQTVVDQAFPAATDPNFPGGFIPAGYDDWIAIQLPPGARGMVHGSEILYRRFVRIATDASGEPMQGWTPNDPYEFYVWSPRISGPSGLNANVGVLVFNPFGRDYVERSAYGNVPLTARIDYDVLDWRIIREDRPMPASPPFQVALTLRNIKRVGEYNDDQTVYDGLMPGSNADMVIYNVGTGVPVPPIDGATGLRNYTVDYRNGVVTFSDAYGTANASGTYRFLYKARGDWSLQVMKAGASYRRRYNANLGFNEFYVGGGNSGGQPNRIYLPLTEAGKTVAVRLLRVRDASGRYSELPNLTFQVNADRGGFITLANQAVTYVEIPAGYVLDPGIHDAVDGLQGVSFRARVVWRNGSSVTETSTGNVLNTRWRKVDVDTILTRRPQQ